MPYNVYNPNGTQHSVPDNAIDATYYDATNHVGIQLVGRNTVDYGAAIAQNFLQLIQNFAGPNPPSDAIALLGQFWFNTTDLNMYVRINNNTTGGLANWKVLGSGTSGSTVTWYAPDGTTPVAKVLTAIPAGATPSDYVLVTDSAVSPATLGYLKVVADTNMNVAIYAGDGTTLLGYGYPLN